ncbi:hypothetical protein IWQ61_005678 [Dispira simplex]|nr:hypothetical protein IWQ61_005678 [Dispira simplex]
MSSCFDFLSDDVVEEVARYLDRKDLVTLSCVDKSLRYRLTPLVFSEVRLGGSQTQYYTSFNIDPLSSLRPYGHLVKKVTYSAHVVPLENPQFLFNAALSLTPHVTQLYLYGLDSRSTSYLNSYLLPVASQLTHLSLAHTERINNEIQGSYLYNGLVRARRLQYLELIGSQFRLAESEWKDVFRVCHELRVLRTRGCGDNGMVNALAQHPRRLETLQISFHYVSPHVLASLPLACPQLRFLFIYPLPAVANFIVENITPRNLPCLERLDLTCNSFERVPPDSLSHERYRRMFNHAWPNLKQLCLDNIHLNDSVLELMCENCPNLEELSLDECRCSSRAYRTVLEQCTRLQGLRIRDLHSKFLSRLFPPKLGCTQLRKLAIIIANFKASWVYHLQTQLSTLEEISLYKLNKDTSAETLRLMFPSVKISYIC